MNKIELYEEMYKDGFSFGKNWKKFLQKLNENKIKNAEVSLKEFLRINLKEKTFLDLGCGSGLFSLAARNLGASVISVDIDENSLECAKYLKSKFYPNDNNWKILKGSALDKSFLESLGKYDIVYSWGVLHHTGDMWKALDYVSNLVKDNGLLYIAIYNKYEGFPFSSEDWLKIKKLYNKSPKIIKKIIEFLYIAYYIFGLTIFGKNPYSYIKNYNKINYRGMDFFTDAIDWLGGYPYEFASINEIKKFFEEKGFELIRTKETKREGCNEYLFRRGVR